MPMWYLSQNGEVAAQPIGEGRLLEMANAGMLTPEDQVALHGTEDWLPAGDVVASVQAELEETQRPKSQTQPPAKRVRKRSPLLILLSLAVFLLGLGFLISGLLAINFLWMVVGVVVLLSAAVLDRPWWICEACGNRVEKTSVQCASCGRRLGK